MNISLPEELKQYIEAKTKAGDSTPSEYVQELIREDQKRQAQELLERQLMECLNSGDIIPADEKFWTNLKIEAGNQIKSRQSTKIERK